jgi:hypothetical protein
MKKIFTLLFISTLLFSCSEEENKPTQEIDSVDLMARVKAGEFDNSKYGIYKGSFATDDGSYRGVFQVEMDGKAEPKVAIFLPDGSKSQALALTDFNKGRTTETIKFANQDFQFDLTTDEFGNDPVASKVVYKGKEGSAMIAKETSKQAVKQKSGFFVCTINCASHPELGEGNSQTFNTQIINYTTGDATGSQNDITFTLTLNGKSYSGTLVQSNCQQSSPFTNRCSLSGTVQANSGPVQVTGRHTYSFTGDDCSTFDRGKLVYDSTVFGHIEGAWETDGGTAYTTPSGDECF